MRFDFCWSCKMNKYLAALFCVFALDDCSRSNETTPAGGGFRKFVTREIDINDASRTTKGRQQGKAAAKAAGH